MAELENILIKWLASESLKLKWIEDQEKNVNRLLQPCSFCANSNSNSDVDVVSADDIICVSCLCPEELCDDDGQKGLIGVITRKYKDGKNPLLKNINPNLYNLVRNCLVDISSTGAISEKIKNDIKLLESKSL